MRHRIKWALWTGAGLALVLLVQQLLWGKLLPYSPLAPGFTRRELDHVVILEEKGVASGSCDWADTLVTGVEAFHQLGFRHKPRIFLFGSDAGYGRRSPSRARLCAFYNGAVVVSAKVQREHAAGVAPLDVYLRHELSHSLLYQHMRPWLWPRYPRWLLEGLATWSAGQPGTFVYPSLAQAERWMRDGNWMPPQVFGTKAEDNVVLRVPHRQPFIYVEFAALVAELERRGGRERLLRHAKTLLREGDAEAVFRDCHGLGFEEFLAQYRARLADPSGQP